MDQGAISQAHDHLFKRLLEEPGVARTLLRERLPPALVARLEDGSPEPVPAVFIGGELRETQADQRFRLRLRGGQIAWVQCLVEHKSALDHRVGLQLLGYLAAAYAQLGRDAKQHRKLPLIVALVVYHGPARWTLPRRFSDGLAVDQELLPLALDFPLEVFDVGRFTPAELSADPHLRGGLLLLRYALRMPPGDPVQLLAALLEELRGMSDGFLEVAGTYMYLYFQGVRLEELRMAIRQVMPDKEERMLSTPAQDSRDEGRAEGRAEGAASALAKALLQMLERRSGAVPPELARRIQLAPIPELEVWLARILDGENPEKVFDLPRR